MERRRRSGDVKVLVVDDEADLRELLDMTLARMGLTAALAGTVQEAKRLLGEQSFQLCLTDMKLPDGDGLQLVRHIGEHCRDLPVAVITAYGSLDNAVTALKAGAFDYLAKPVSLDQLRALVRSAISLPGPGERAPAHEGEGTLDGVSANMEQVRALIEKLSRSQAPVHIYGESGSGKELAARMVHGGSARKEGPFIAVNCGALPEQLMESEFFGYRKGAFTGADADRDGFFQAASGGTLFLDEVGDLPLSMQVKLLRALQEKRVRRVGSQQEEAVDVRIISATHRSLKQLVDAGRFRQDLYYRLNVIDLRMPSLRERREDIPVLAKALLAKVSGGRVHPDFTQAALEALCTYPFPGNVRELENVIERACALVSGPVIDAHDLQLEPGPDEAAPPPGERTLPLQEHLDRVERQAIDDALRQTRFNRTAAAKLLGVTFRSLRYRMERLGMKD